MRKKEIVLRFLTKKWLEPEPYGRQFLELFYNKYPEIAPEYSNYWEPFKYRVETVDAAMKYYTLHLNEPEFWARRRSPPTGQTIVGCDTQNCDACIEFTWRKKIPWFDIFEDMFDLVEPYHAHMHIFAAPEENFERNKNNVAYYKFLNFLTGVQIERLGIHELAWQTYFGRRYEDRMDLEAIKKTGVRVIEKAGGFAEGGGVLIRLTDNIEDLLTDFEAVDARRQAVKACFTPGTFQPYGPHKD